MAIDDVADLHFGAPIDGCQQVTVYSFVDSEQIDNVTDLALNRFRDFYEKGKGRKAGSITKRDIFNYTYATLHDPDYHRRYELNQVGIPQDSVLYQLLALVRLGT